MNNCSPLLKKLLLACVLLIIICYYNYRYHNIRTENVSSSEQLITKDFVRVESKKLSDSSRAILYWTKFWSWDYAMGLGSNPFKGCEYKNCFTTYNKSLLNVEDFHAIVFHGSIYDKKVHGIPGIRKKNQNYIYFNIEAPPNKFKYNPNFTLFDSFYNWTITYRFDSDLTERYGHFTKFKSNNSLPTIKDVKKKTKLVAWFVSHCNTSSRREALVKEMQKYIPVDVYGKCGNLSCARNGYISTNDCYTMLENTYKFYLSFENSLCQDYFTEKLYYILNKNIIPVVYGGNDNTVLAPPNSTINVKDFENVKQLTDYLKFLDGNITEYLKYFNWRKNYVRTTYHGIACDLCKKLNAPLSFQTYKDFKSWQWGTSNQPTCMIDDNLPPIVKNIPI